MEKDTSTLCDNMEDDRFESRFGFTDDALRTSLQLRRYKRLLGIAFVLIGICLVVTIISLAYSIKTSHESSPTSTASTAKLVNGPGGPQSLKALEKLKAEIIDQQRSLNKTVEDLKGLKTSFASNQQTSSQTLMKLNETVKDNQAKTLREIQKLRTDLEAQLDRTQQAWNGLNISMRAASRYFNASIMRMQDEQVTEIRRLHRLLTAQINVMQQEIVRFVNQSLPGVTIATFPPFTTPPPAPPLVPCTSPDTVNLTESWRKDHNGSNIKPRAGNNYNCDAHLFDDMQWFRIGGAAGKRILNSCPPKYSCGSHGGIWTNATMPTQVGRIVKVPLHGSWSHCTWYPFDQDNSLTVLRCSPAYGDFVYKIDGKTGCHWSVCGMD